MNPSKDVQQKIAQKLQKSTSKGVTPQNSRKNSVENKNLAKNCHSKPVSRKNSMEVRKKVGEKPVVNVNSKEDEKTVYVKKSESKRNSVKEIKVDEIKKDFIYESKKEKCQNINNLPANAPNERKINQKNTKISESKFDTVIYLKGDMKENKTDPSILISKNQTVYFTPTKMKEFIKKEVDKSNHNMKETDSDVEELPEPEGITETKEKNTASIFKDAVYYGI